MRGSGCEAPERRGQEPHRPLVATARGGAGDRGASMAARRLKCPACGLLPLAGEEHRSASDCESDLAEVAAMQSVHEQTVAMSKLFDYLDQQKGVGK